LIHLKYFEIKARQEAANHSIEYDLKVQRD